MAAQQKTFLLLGGNGALGQIVAPYLRGRGHTVVATSRMDFEIKPGNHEEALRNLGQLRPDLVVNLAGYGREHTMSRPVEDVVSLNSVFPKNAAQYFADLGIPMVHVSTDCVFSGKRGPYDETSIVDAEELYGLSKAAADQAPCIILRGSFLGPGLPASKHGLLEWIFAQKGKSIVGFTNQYWNGITYLKLAQIIEQIGFSSTRLVGVFHLPSLKTISRLDLIKCVSDKFELGIEVSGQIADKPLNRTLRTSHKEFAELLNEDLDRQIQNLRDFLQCRQHAAFKCAEDRPTP